MAKILAPNKKYTGVTASVAFADGVGSTDKPHLIKWFKEKGFEVTADSPAPTPEASKPEKPAAKSPG